MHNAKSVFWILVNSCLVLLLIGGLIGIGTLLRFSNAIPASRVITVSGEGKTAISPDLATVTFAVVSQGDKADEVQTANTTKINRALTFVKNQGVNAEDIKTTGYNLYPQYSYDKNSGRSSISGYELSQMVTVKIHDLTKTSQIVGGLTSVGINQISSVDYSIENPEAQRARARSEAFMNAREKAIGMAQENGVRLVRVVSFSENPESSPFPPVYYGALEAKGGASAPAPDLQPGSQEVTVDVSVTYEIR